MWKKIKVILPKGMWCLWAGSMFSEYWNEKWFCEEVDLIDQFSTIPITPTNPYTCIFMSQVGKRGNHKHLHSKYLVGKVSKYKKWRSKI